VRSDVETVDGYIASQPAAIRKRLQAVRAAVRRAAPDAEESISYRIPAYKQHGALIYFAAFTDHIGMYPMTAGLKHALARDLSPYLPSKAKGSAHFPHGTPLPLSLIARMVKIRLAENLARAGAKASGAKKKAASKAAVRTSARSNGTAKPARLR